MKNEKGKDTFCNFCLKPSSEVSFLIAGPNVYICDECVDLCYKAINDKNENKNIDKNNITKINNIPRPDEIYSYLEKHVIGQKIAKRILSVAIFKHYKRVNDKSMEYKKENIFLVGPTGCGKTLLLETISKFLDIPFASCTATSLTEAGYVGNDVEYVLQRLLKSADFNVEKAEKGIVFIDEIDKKARKSENFSVTRDVSGEGVQQSLLRMIEGDIINIPVQSSKKNPQGETIDINTKNILFIVGGAFVGIDDIIYRRLNKGKLSIGFNAEIKTEEKVKDKDILMKIEPVDLIDFGMIPEFVGRIPVICPFFELSLEEMVQVLTVPENSLISQYKNFFFSEKVELEFTEEALKEIALNAKAKKIGARGLHSIVEKIMIPYEFDIKKYENKKIKIDIDDVRKNLNYENHPSDN